MKRIFLLAALFTLLALAPAQARDQIRIVGSSTVYPFATAVAEEFGHTSKNPAPVVESTGTGGGIKLFCAGAGIDTPDIANASRAMKKSEFEDCDKNAAGNITEVKIGYDGIVIAHAKKDKPLALTLRQVYLALAKEVPGKDGKIGPNTYKTWKDVDPSLPDHKIEVLGPPPTSGTRDAFVELAMEGGCKTFDDIAALKKSDEDRYKKLCHSVREDGAYVEAGENDNLIIQKITANPNALGIFGYSFLQQNADKVQAAAVEGVVPSMEGILSGEYKLARPLFFYVKNAHIGVIPGLKEYLAAFTDEKAMGEFGYLADKGLIPLAAADLKAMQERAEKLTPFKP